MVTDTNGEPIVGANVVVQNNHSIGAITDIDGNFRLSLPQETKALVVSFIGMREKVIRITDKVDKIKVILEDDSQALGRGCCGRLWPAEKEESGGVYHTN